MKSVRLTLVTVMLISTGIILQSCKKKDPSKIKNSKAVIRVGHFPNVTHAQALVAHAMSRSGKGWFEEKLGVEIQWSSYNAGPGAMEAIFANSIDLTFVGPSPALNAYMRAIGKEIRIIAGSAEGGAALVVHSDGNIKSPEDFRGKKIATPQIGNTQDVECRSWLKSKGFKITQTGGDVLVIPTSNPDQVSLFKRSELDAVWTVEPWVTIIEKDAGGKIFLSEKKSLTTVLAARIKFLEENGELVKKFVDAHKELTKWIQSHPEEAQKLIAEEIAAETTKKIPPEVLSKAWGRITFTSEVYQKQFDDFIKKAKDVGFLTSDVDFSHIVEAKNGSTGKK